MTWDGLVLDPKSTEKVTKVSQGEHSKRPRTEGISSRGSGPGEFSVKRSEEKYSVCGIRRKHSSVSVFGSDSCHSVLNVYFSKSMRRISSGSGKREVSKHNIRYNSSLGYLLRSRMLYT